MTSGWFHDRLTRTGDAFLLFTFWVTSSLAHGSRVTHPVVQVACMAGRSSTRIVQPRWRFVVEFCAVSHLSVLGDLES